MDGSNTVKLLRLADLAIEESADETAESISKKLFSSAKPLILDWAREQLLLVVRARLKLRNRRNAAPAPYQPFLEGFRDLSVSLSLNAGARLPLARATITMLRKELKAQKPKLGAKAVRLMSLIDSMQPYAQVKRGLTVERYCELRAAGVSVKEFAGQEVKV